MPVLHQCTEQPALNICLCNRNEVTEESILRHAMLQMPYKCFMVRNQTAMSKSHDCFVSHSVLIYQSPFTFTPRLPVLWILNLQGVAYIICSLCVSI